MELDAGNLAALDNRREPLTVFGGGDGIAGERGDKAVREVHLRSRGNTFDNPQVEPRLERIPPDMRNLQASLRRHVQTPAAPTEHAKSRAVRRFVAALEQPLHPEADAEQRLPVADETENGINPGA